MTMLIARTMKTPRCHACCEKNPSSLKLRRDARAAVTPTPPKVSLSRPQFTCPLSGSRRTPAQTTPAELSCPVLNPLGAHASSMHHTHRVNPDLLQNRERRLVCRVIPMQDRDSTVSNFARLIRVFDRPCDAIAFGDGASPQAFSAAARVTARPASSRGARARDFAASGRAVREKVRSRSRGTTSTPPPAASSLRALPPSYILPFPHKSARLRMGFVMVENA